MRRRLALQANSVRFAHGALPQNFWIKALGFTKEIMETNKPIGAYLSQRNADDSHLNRNEDHIQLILGQTRDMNTAFVKYWS